VKRHTFIIAVQVESVYEINKTVEENVTSSSSTTEDEESTLQS